MPDLPLNPDTELWRWGPIQGRLFYVDDFVEGIFGPNHFYKEYEYHWPTCLSLSRERRFVFVCEFSALRKAGEAVFLAYMLPLEARALMRNKYEADVATLRKVEQTTLDLNLSALSDAKFYSAWNQLHAATIAFWTHVTIPELANYGSLSMLEEALRKSGVPETDIGESMEALTAPEQPSFYQQEEIALAETNDFSAHARNYFWIKNSYTDVEALDEAFFAAHKKEIPPDIRTEVVKKQRESAEKKRTCQAQHHLPQEVMDIASAIVVGIEWQDERKAVIFEYLHYKELLLQEAARRFGCDKDSLKDFRISEIAQMIENKTFSAEAAQERRKAGAFVCRDGAVMATDFATAQKYWDLYAEEKTSNVSEFSGIVVSKGASSVVRGKARILFDPKAGTVLPGEILVTSMTTPDFIFSMKNAIAIITDTGGLTSHAAVVSRELGKPCIVNTRIATKAIKDGDMVEVDAEKGIVRILT